MSDKKRTPVNHNKPQNTQNAKYKRKSYIQDVSQEKSNIWLLLPIILSMSVLPFITKLKEYNTHLSDYSWFTYNDEYTDLFLLYKQKFFLIITFAMAFILISKFFINRKELNFSYIFIPLGIYALLALLSSLFSEYRKFSFSGIHEHFESIFVLFGYCLLVYYATVYVKTERDFEIITNCFVVSIIVMGLLALSQYLGKDFLRTKMGLSLIFPEKYMNHLDLISFKFEKGRVYLTLYNPNYVGSYVALAVPFLIILALLIRKKFWKLVLYILAIAGMFIALIGSESKTGIIALIATAVLGIIIFSKKLIKYFYFSIPALLFAVCTVILYNRANDNILAEQLKKAINFSKTEVSLQDIKTLDDEVVITYKNNNIHIKFFTFDDGYAYFEITDDDNNNIPLQQIEGYLSFTVKDDRFPEFEIGATEYEEDLCFYVTIDGHEWYFTNQTDDGTYYMINLYGKLDKIVTAPSAVFTGYERYASGRGYIWSRTIPLLRKYIILGSGADTFQLVFPMQDYVNRYNFGYYDQIITKPHNMYLQIGVQTGVLSLLAFLIFYAIYFISSLRLYIKGHYKSFYSQVGVAIFLSTFCYMVVGIANDSILAVAPIFWAMMGLGICANIKAKKCIKEEMSLSKSDTETKLAAN